MMNEDNLVQIEWRLLNMMVERRIRRVTELRKKLLALGIEISSQQMGRLVNQFPDRLNTTYLRGLMTVLNCEVSDLIRVHPPGTNVEQLHQPHQSSTTDDHTPKRKKPAANRKDLGPALPPGFDD